MGRQHAQVPPAVRPAQWRRMDTTVTHNAAATRFEARPGRPPGPVQLPPRWARCWCCTTPRCPPPWPARAWRPRWCRPRWPGRANEGLQVRPSCSYVADLHAAPPRDAGPAGRAMTVGAARADLRTPAEVLSLLVRRAPPPPTPRAEWFRKDAAFDALIRSATLAPRCRPGAGRGALDLHRVGAQLCEFTAKRGDLDRRFTPSATALEGPAGPGPVAQRRARLRDRDRAGSATCGPLRVRGRADGYDPRRAAWKRSRPSAATRTRSRPTAACCTGRSCRPTARCSAAPAAWRRDAPGAGVRRRGQPGRGGAAAGLCSADELDAALAKRCEAFLAWAQQEAAPPRRARRRRCRQLPFRPASSARPA
jgi:hypothetical protein